MKYKISSFAGDILNRLGRNKLMLCLASHVENVNAACAKIIYYLFLDEINRKCAKFKIYFLKPKI